MKKLLLFCLLPVLSVAQPGSIDSTFDPEGGANLPISTTAIQGNGKIIIGGDLTTFDGTTRNRIARLNADGSHDTSFDPGTGATGPINTTSIQSDGKIIVGGSFTNFNGTTKNSIVRLNADGSLDSSFNTGTGVDLSIWTTSIQNDGKIIIGGDFSTYNGTARNGIARMNTDGSLDTSFDPGTGANGYIFASSIQSDGKVIVSGDFTTFDGTTRNRIARLNTDGSLDTSFNPGTGANDFIMNTSIQSDGKIIIGGWFTTYNDTPKNYITRLNADGSLDTSFDTGTGASYYIFASSIQSDGKIIIGGSFTNVNNTTRNHIARLNADGSLDTSFDPGIGANGRVETISIQNDGEIIIGGSFTSYNGVLRHRIARVLSGSTMGIDDLTDENKKIIIYPNPFSNKTTLYTKNELNKATLTVYNSLGQPVKEVKNISGQKALLNRGNLPAGMYFIRLSQDNHIKMSDKLLVTD